MLLYTVFIYFSKAFNTVSREGSGKYSIKFRCTKKFLNLTELSMREYKPMYLTETLNQEILPLNRFQKETCLGQNSVFTLLLGYTKSGF